MPELIIEDIDISLSESETEIVQEGMSKTKVLYIKGPYLQAECMNGNKRIYPKAVIEREVEKFNKKILEKRSVGEFEHPQSSSINMERISHLVTELKMDGNNAYGKARVLNRPEFKYGQIAFALHEEGIKIGVSSRGTGTLKNGVVQNDYDFVCPDLVWQPSGPQCWLDGIMESKKEWVIENGILTEQEIIDILKEEDKIVVETKYSKEDREAALMKLFTEQMNKISNKSKGKK